MDTSPRSLRTSAASPRDSSRARAAASEASRSLSAASAASDRSEATLSSSAAAAASRAESRARRRWFSCCREASLREKAREASLRASWSWDFGSRASTCF